MSFMDKLSGANIGKATLEALGKNQGVIDKFQNDGNTLANDAMVNSLGVIQGASGLYDPYREAGVGAVGTIQDALGLRGTEGNARATQAFQTSPGYDFRMQQGEQAALRGASAAGMLNSGNTLTALNEYGQGVADQEYGTWLDRLSGLSSQGMQAVAGKSALAGAHSDLYGQYADRRLGIESGVSQGTMGINRDTASVQEQQQQAKNSFFGKLVGTAANIGTKALTGGLF